MDISFVSWRLLCSNETRPRTWPLLNKITIFIFPNDRFIDPIFYARPLL